MSNTQLPEGVTSEMVAEFKAKHSGEIRLAELFDSEGGSHGFVIVGKPSPNVIGQFERFIDKDPMKARDILLKGTLCTRRDEIFSWEKNSEQYAAAFDAAAQMLPVGKSILKKL